MECDDWGQKQSGQAQPLQGTIVKGVGGSYEIVVSDGPAVLAVARGIFRKNRIVPTVGDHVYIESSGDPDIPYVISEILPRKNLLVRPSVANVDVLILTFAKNKPLPDLCLLDKLLIICAKQQITPVIWMTKDDLESEDITSIIQIYRDAGYETFSSSIDETIPFARVSHLFSGKCVGFAGPSGVGKSTLCNMLTGGVNMEVGSISERLNRGKHTTRHVELFPVGDGFLIDTPGFSSLELKDVDIKLDVVILGYPEIARVREKCYFQDCRHIGESGCAINQFTIDPGRLLRYHEFIDYLIHNKPYTNKHQERSHGKK